MRAYLLAVGALSAAAAAWASQEYKPWPLASDPFTCEVPSDWSPSPGKGLHVVLAAPEGAYAPGMHVDHYRHGKDGFDSAQNFIDTQLGVTGVSEREWKKMGVSNPIPRHPAVVRAVKVAGIGASRFDVQKGMRSKPEVYVNGKLITRKAQKGVVMLRKAFVVIPQKDGFWVLRYSAEEKEFDRHLPKFEHLINTFQLKGA